MRSAIAEYLNTYNSFELFRISHWTAILASYGKLEFVNIKTIHIR